MQQEPTNQEILEAIHAFAGQVDQRFDRVESRLTRIETTMVTKEYLDDKLANLRGDLTVLMRKEDRKVGTLIEVLRAHKVISDEEATHILSMEPFPLTS